MLDKDAQIFHDLFAEDLDLTYFINVFVRVENERYFLCHQSSELVLLKVILCQLKFSVRWRIVLIDKLDVRFAVVFLGHFLDLSQILLNHLSEWSILLILRRFFIQLSLL